VWNEIKCFLIGIILQLFEPGKLPSAYVPGDHVPKSSAPQQFVAVKVRPSASSIS
jgi:hypothetical protein